MTTNTEKWATFKRDNSDRVGQTVINVNGQEVQNSLVLSDESYAEVGALSVTVVAKDWLDGEDNRVVLSKQELEALKLINLGA